jgi:hypothetical protein
VEGRFSIMKMKEVTDVASQKLYHFYSPHLELKISHLLKFYTVSRIYNVSHIYSFCVGFTCVEITLKNRFPMIPSAKRVIESNTHLGLIGKV